jgi:acyl carrier protein
MHLQYDDVASRIEAFIRTQFDVRPDDPGFNRKADLYESGYVDSVGVAELLEFLREEFRLEVPESDLLGDDFSTIEGIAGIVLEYQQSGSPGPSVWLGQAAASP